MTNKQRARALAQARKLGLTGHAVLRYVYPDEQNRFFTGLPAKPKARPNAHKTLWTPLPGCANKRHKKRLHAQTL